MSSEHARPHFGHGQSDLEESLDGPSILDQMRLGLFHQGRSMVILENTFTAVSSLYSKFSILTARPNSGKDEEKPGSLGHSDQRAPEAKFRKGDPDP